MGTNLTHIRYSSLWTMVLSLKLFHTYLHQKCCGYQPCNKLFIVHCDGFLGHFPPLWTRSNLSFSLGKTVKTYHSDIVSIQQNLIQFCHSSSFWCAFTIINTMDKTLLLIYSYITKGTQISNKVNHTEQNLDKNKQLFRF